MKTDCMNIINKILRLAVVFSAVAISANGQELAVKTNLLYDATSTINLGAEVGLSKKWTLDVSGNYNPWTFNEGRKMKHWLVQPEGRYWFCQKFQKWFIGPHLLGGQFNFEGMLPFGFHDGKFFGVESSALRDHRFQGWLIGGGVTAGYHCILSSRFSLEFALGVGYAYIDYDKYRCETCGGKLEHNNRNYFGPTKAAISLVYMIK
jgi:hypothetical protein